MDDAVFAVNASPGFDPVQVNLREGKLESGTLAKRFNLDLPASGELTSFSLDIDHLLPKPKDATGEARMLVGKREVSGLDGAGIECGRQRSMKAAPRSRRMAGR